MRRLKFIDVSGLGNSGKSAVVDLLREVDGLWVPHFSFEFDFLRVSGGLMDLRLHARSNWSFIGADAALKRFLRTSIRMGIDPKWYDLRGLFLSTSQRYDRAFGGRFRGLAEEFADSLVIGQYLADWPFDDLLDPPFGVFSRKILKKLGLGRALMRRVRLVDGSGFDDKAARFLDRLYETVVGPDIGSVILNNGFEPFNPSPYLDMLPGSKQVIVMRDPRDIYLSGRDARKLSDDERRLLSFDNQGLNKTFLGANDVEMFVSRLDLYYKNLCGDEDPRILKVFFEDLVEKYEDTISKIFSFLEIDPSRHVRKGQRFDPEKSAKNVGLWKHTSAKGEIEFIERELKVRIPG